MASKYIDWDELLLTADPKKKEIEVSFKKIDGSGVLFKGNTEPGTPGGATEDPDDEGSCKNEVEIVSNDVFLLEDYSEHYIYIALRTAPIEYMEIDLLFTDGTIEWPDYQYQAVTVQLWPENFIINGNGPSYISFLLLELGDIDILLDEEGEVMDANYFAQITAVRGFTEEEDQTPCFNAEPISIDFAGEAIQQPPFPGGGGPVPPQYTPTNPNPCESGIDCESSANLVVNSGSRAGVFGLYPSSKINQFITTPLITPFQKIQQIQKGDGDLSGWSRLGNFEGYAGSNLNLKNYMLDENISICGEDVDIVTGFPQDIFVTSEYLSGGCESIYPYNQEDEVKFTQKAIFVVFMQPATSVGATTWISQTSVLTIKAAYTPETPWTTVGGGSTVNMAVVGNGAGQPHTIESGGVAVGTYDFNAPGANILTIGYETTIQADWKVNQEDYLERYMNTSGGGVITLKGKGANETLMASAFSSARYEQGGLYPYYGTVTLSEGSGISRGVARYNPGGTILSGGHGGEDIFLAVQKSVSTYDAPSYCQRIP